MKHKQRKDISIVFTLLFILVAVLILYGVLNQNKTDQKYETTQEELIIYILDQLSEREAELKEQFSDRTEEVNEALVDISEKREMYSNALKKLDNGEEISEEFSKESLLNKIIENLEKEKMKAENTAVYDENIKVFQNMLNNLKKSKN